MTSIELKTGHAGETAHLIIDGEDVSQKAKAVTIRFAAYERPRATVFVEYRTDQVDASGDFEEKEEDE